MKLRRKQGLTTTQIIAFGFLGAILIGMVLLMLPVSSADGTWTAPLDAVFCCYICMCYGTYYPVDSKPLEPVRAGGNSYIDTVWRAWNSNIFNSSITYGRQVYYVKGQASYKGCI